MRGENANQSKLIDKNSEKRSIVDYNNCKIKESRAIHETITMRVNLTGDSHQTFVQTSKSNVNQYRFEEESIPKIPAFTQNYVDVLLANLREKINCLNEEKNSNVSNNGRFSKFADPMVTKCEHDCRFASPRWVQDKSRLFAKDIKPIYTDPRVSFIERIQDIWIQEGTSSQWAVLHKHNKIIPSLRIDAGNGINSEENGKDDKPSGSGSCHVGVQYTASTSENQQEKLEKKISQLVVAHGK